MLRAWVVPGMLMVLSTVAHADEAEDLVAKGEELGRQGEWTQAITSFKQADAITPRAKHACMIALAYTRREHWAQAEVFFARCHERAKETDPLPEWTAETEAQLAEKLAGAHVPPVMIAVTPAAIASTAAIAISGFDPDETTAPRMLHLPPGHYSIQVSAPGYMKQSRDIDIAAGTSPQIAFALVPLTVPNPARDTRLPLYLMGAGGVLALTALAIDLTKIQSLREDMAKSQFLYQANAGAFDTWRATTIGLYAAGAIMVGVGAYLEVRRRDLPFMIEASAGHDGATVGLSWSR